VRRRGRGEEEEEGEEGGERGGMVRRKRVVQARMVRGSQMSGVPGFLLGTIG